MRAWDDYSQVWYGTGEKHNAESENPAATTEQATVAVAEHLPIGLARIVVWDYAREFRGDLLAVGTLPGFTQKLVVDQDRCLVVGTSMDNRTTPRFFLWQVAQADGRHKEVEVFLKLRPGRCHAVLCGDKMCAADQQFIDFVDLKTDARCSDVVEFWTEWLFAFGSRYVIVLSEFCVAIFDTRQKNRRRRDLESKLGLLREEKETAVLEQQATEPWLSASGDFLVLSGADRLAVVDLNFNLVWRQPEAWYENQTRLDLTSETFVAVCDRVHVSDFRLVRLSDRAVWHFRLTGFVTFGWRDAPALALVENDSALAVCMQRRILVFDLTTKQTRGPYELLHGIDPRSVPRLFTLRDKRTVLVKIFGSFEGHSWLLWDTREHTVTQIYGSNRSHAGLRDIHVLPSGVVVGVVPIMAHRTLTTLIVAFI